ncbi:hypothetical protein EU805_01485 [Salipiger sp. IMCC34102]|uniref:hypothetical protein n=1 Tax=Salipiger sp. IMCC34102 TaxID=2510647 RepID=UPI00101BB2A2|nr:hypothetical protein [Salipiger sp. IMCC34102]RYH04072.1 hypothetical protein EU805_01485 [Salipiger sp. IMCC34102]
MRTLLIAAALLAAGPATALSCLRPDPLASFDMAAQSELPYLVLSGRITPIGAPPAEDQAGAYAARLTGEGLAYEGLTVPFDETVTLDLQCNGPWCGVPPGDDPVLVFARVDGERPLIELDPCSTWVFPAPDRQTEEALAQCLTDGACSP